MKPEKGNSGFAVTAAILLLIATILLTSCATSVGLSESGSEPDGRKGITYRIRGEGPEGAWFGWRDVDSRYFALTELRRGEWTLYAEKLDADGKTIAKGNITTFVTEDRPVADIAFTAEGLGDINCGLRWSPSQCMNPEIKVYVQDRKGNWYPRPEAEVTLGEDGCSATWNANGVDAGSYIARFVLYDGNSEIAGAVSALRVVDGYVSTGDVTFSVGYLNVPFGVRVDEEPVFAQGGTIEIDSGCAVYRDRDGNPQEVAWFVDGREMSTGYALSLDTTMEKDFYRLDAVAETDNVSCSASATVLVHSTGVYELSNVKDSSIGFSRKPS